MVGSAVDPAEVDAEDRVRVRFVALFAVAVSGFAVVVASEESSASDFFAVDLAAVVFAVVFAVVLVAVFFAVDLAAAFFAVDLAVVFFAVDLAVVLLAVVFFAAGVASAEASAPWGGPAGLEAPRRRGRAVVDESELVRGSCGVESWSTMRVVPFAGRG